MSPIVVSGAANDDILAQVGAAAASLAPVSLAELGEAALMDRVDRKYMIPAGTLADLLAELAGDYRVLEVEGRRLAAYTTRYYDTADLSFYTAHHNGRAPRFKVRVRTYEGAESGYLEVKRKNAAGRTQKSRMLLDGGAEPLAQLGGEGLAFDGLPAGLGETMTVEYRRLTLVRKTAAERITLDLMLTFRRGDEVRVFPGVAIAEVKQGGHFASPFVAAMRARGLRQGSISKYCAGIATIETGAKSNRFRPSLRRLAQLGA